VTLLTTRTDEPIPGYRVVKRIGAGGYGEVWTAQAPGDLTKAIKFVYGLLDEDRASRELKALSRIKSVRHPFLLSLERIEVVDGQLLIVTELADCSLKDRFEECRKSGQPGIPREELLKHLRDAADALDYMSEQHSLQHLDVKPENLLLLGGRIKVADFGLVKDIQDHTASMMGGLTPVYAPPEVFEGRPSRHSDQYSLAIVYQEMLTGVLPFPGRTAAQLAAQHLNAKPRLNALSAGDQGPIGRALAKKPDGRFARCSDLVDALVHAGKQSGGVLPGGASAKGAQPSGNSATQAGTRTSDDMLADLDAASKSAEVAATGLLGHTTQPPSRSKDAAPRVTQTRSPRMSLTPEEAAALVRAPAVEGAPGLGDLQDAPPLVDLPPLAVDMQAPALRPTLLIGLGGCGGRILRRLRRRLDDRLSPDHRGVVAMLLFDSDARELALASHGDELGQLRPEETVAMPLRRSQDYRNDSRRILEWLSRRWLYNIPRSQQTEGLRPLGRLALADHAETALPKLKAAVTAVQQRSAGLGVAPRVILCGSLCGGTGGGLVGDIVFAVRQMLDELQAASAEVLAVLAYGTNRNPQQQELATASGISTLTELAQFHRPSAIYPGDPGCGLKSRPASAGGLDAAYVVHVGEEMSNQQWESACDNIAEFLLLDAITPAGHVLRAAREEPSDVPGLKVRSFGLYQLGFAHDKLVDDAVRRVCRETIARWDGPTNKPEARKAAPRLLPSAQAHAHVAAEPVPVVAPVEIESVSATLAKALGVDADPLVQRAIGLATAELGGDAEAFFRNLMGPPDPGNDGLMLQRWLGSAYELFGRPQEDLSAPALPGELAQALDHRIGPWIAEVGTSLRKGIEAIVEEPGARIAGARRAAKWFVAHLKSLVDRMREMRGRVMAEWRTVEACLDPAQPDRPAKGKLPRRTHAELATLFQQYCRLRMFDLAAVRAGQVAYALQSHAGAAHDALLDLGRELEHLAAQFPAEDTVSCTASSTSLEFCSMRETVAEHLRSAEDLLACQIDDQIAKSLFNVKGGLRAVISAGGEAREQLVSLLRTTSRQAVLTKLQSIDLASLLLAGAASDSPLHKCLTDAQPWLQRCGGRRRLLCVIPEQLAEHYNSATLAAQLGPNVFRQLPAIVPDSTGDLVLLYELGDLSLPHVAANLCDFRADLIDAAARLHTRSDITWAPLVG
jgi:serine/threonine protein kinase